MDLSGWIPPEAWAILVLVALVGGWIVWQVGSFLAAHVTVGLQ